MSYKVDELMALRDSVSESAVSLDKFNDEEVVRGQSWALPSFILHHSPHLSGNHVSHAGRARVPLYPPTHYERYRIIPHLVCLWSRFSFIIT
jgi:hypothetical protein